MTENELRTMVLLSLQSAMLGEIFPEMRSISCSWTSKNVNIRVVVDGEVDDMESIDFIHTEMIASLPEDIHVSIENIRVDSPQAINECSLAVCVYQRRE